MWPEAPKGAAQPSMITNPCHGPGNKSAHKPFAASERLLCKSQAFEHLLRRKIFSEEVDSLFCLPWFKPATSFYTHSANNHSLGLPCIDILGLTCEMKGGKKKVFHTWEGNTCWSQVFLLWWPRAIRRAYIPFLGRWWRTPIDVAYSSPQGIRGQDCLDRTPVQGHPDAVLLKTLRKAEREAEDPVFKVHCFFRWGLL